MSHYVYRITNIADNKHYYGTRTTNVKPIEDIGIQYFSSSFDKKFIQDQKNNPLNYKYKVVRIFNSRKKALELEIKLHQKFEVSINESFYNRSKQTSTGFDTTGTTRIFTQEHKDNMSKAGKGRITSDITKEKISKSRIGKYKGDENPFYGKTHSDISKKIQGEKTKIWLADNEHPKGMLNKSHSDETKEKQRTANLGLKRTDEQKKNYSDAAKLRVWKTVTCPHCKKEGKENGMKRWHFDNCKEKDK